MAGVSIGPRPKYTAHDTAQVLKDLNRLPLFMTQLDPTDGEGGSNMALEALQALAYEGTKSEVVGNFKQQGNEQFMVKRYKEAAGFYTQAIDAALNPGDIEESSSKLEYFGDEDDGSERVLDTRILAKISEEENMTEESEKVEGLLISCYLNRAACNLELQNYRRVINDCADVLKRSPLNAKAYYRSARACLAIDKIDDAKECIERGLEIEPQSSYFSDLKIKVMQRENYLMKVRQQERQREVMPKHIVRF
ncbi:hypothetical protein V1511DRAFT_493305 [Dipodascopsis uninucleata]